MQEIVDSQCMLVEISQLQVNTNGAHVFHVLCGDRRTQLDQLVADFLPADAALTQQDKVRHA
jgi:hypothetical protein